MRERRGWLKSVYLWEVVSDCHHFYLSYSLIKLSLSLLMTFLTILSPVLEVGRSVLMCGAFWLARVNPSRWARIIPLL